MKMISDLNLTVTTGIEKWDEKLILLTETLEMLSKLYGKFHPNISEQMSIISKLLIIIKGGDKKYKIDFLKESLKAIKITHGCDHPFYREGLQFQRIQGRL